jgi:hypothetical protein
MRRKFLGVATLFGLLAFVAVALAAKTEVGPSPGGQFQSLEVNHKPTKPKRPTIVSVDLNQRTADGSTPSLTTNTDVHIPSGMKLGYKDFPTCNPNRLQQPTDESRPPTGCPRKSLIGVGTGVADPRPLLGPDAQDISAPVFAFNGTRQGGRPTYVLWANSPIDPDITIIGKLQGRVLKFVIPQGNPLCGGATGDPNLCAGIKRFTVHRTGGTVTKRKRGKRRKTAYLANPSRCPSGGYKWTFDFKYRNGDTLSPSVGVSC